MSSPNRHANKILIWLLLWVIVFLPYPAAGHWENYARDEPVWGSKPLISYFALTESIINKMRYETGLSSHQWVEVQKIAREEFYSLRTLEMSSQGLVSNLILPLWIKRLVFRIIRYNEKIDAIVDQTDQALRDVLTAQSYEKLIQWIEKQWELEREIHGKTYAKPLSTSRSFQIYATRYDSGGAYYVALPDKCVKFTNGGNSICSGDGYVVGQNYSVFLSYKKSVGAVVGESGPWNVDDNYWSKWNDPTPRRMFADLPLGMPEAQAAYFNGYNGGVDQFGRKVTGPFGIDLARQVSIDIGLQPGNNDWITVSFLWTEGWDSGLVQATPIPGATGISPATALAIVPVQIATAMPDGSITHKVEYGQTLWDIAVAYQTNLQALYVLNNLNENSVIKPGDQILIRETSQRTPDVSEAVTPSPTFTIPERPTITRTSSDITTDTPSITVISSAPIADISENEVAEPGVISGINVLIFAGLGFVGLGIVLVILGKILSRG